MAQGGGQTRGGGQAMKDQDDAAIYGSKRIISNTHGSLQSFQQEVGINNFTLGALDLLKEMEESKKMPEIPQVLMSKEVMKHQIARPPNIPM